METQYNISEIQDKEKVFSVFSKIHLDIEGSNIAKTGWCPSESDEEYYLTKKEYEQAILDYRKANEKVIFKNVSLDWDSCDCCDGYCSHGSYVYAIEIFSNGKKVSVDIPDDECLEFSNNKKYVQIPKNNITVFDFIRMCEICEIELELSEYGYSLIKTT